MSISRARWGLKLALLRMVCGRERSHYPDRCWLEEVIFHQIRREYAPRKLLFIGVEEYTSWYHRLFVPSVFESIDADERKSRFGSPWRHVTASCADLLSHWEREYFDVVVFNGVYGWGVDDRETLERALAQIRSVLKKGGLLVFGFNRTIDPLGILGQDRMYFDAYEPVALGGMRMVVFEHWEEHTFLYFHTA